MPLNAKLPECLVDEFQRDGYIRTTRQRATLGNHSGDLTGLRIDQFQTGGTLSLLNYYSLSESTLKLAKVINILTDNAHS